MGGAFLSKGVNTYLFIICLTDSCLHGIIKNVQCGGNDNTVAPS